MKTFKNIHFTKRDYECTNVVACVSDVAPDANWTPADESILKGLTQLQIVAGVAYWGYL
jgi:hypothetical protein